MTLFFATSLDPTLRCCLHRLAPHSSISKTSLYSLRHSTAQCTKLKRLYLFTKEEIGSLDSVDCYVADHMSQCPES